MLPQSQTPAAHVGEDQSSRQFEARTAHWSNVAAQLLLAAKKLANDYLQDENDDGSLCIDAEHHAAVQALFSAIREVDRAGLSDACAALVLMDVQATATNAPARDPRVPDMFEVQQ